MKACNIKLRRLPVIGWVLSYYEQHDDLISHHRKVRRILFVTELDGAIAYLLFLELGGAL